MSLAKIPSALKMKILKLIKEMFIQIPITVENPIKREDSSQQTELINYEKTSVQLTFEENRIFLRAKKWEKLIYNYNSRKTQCVFGCKNSEKLAFKNRISVTLERKSSKVMHFMKVEYTLISPSISEAVEGLQTVYLSFVFLLKEHGLDMM